MTWSILTSSEESSLIRLHLTSICTGWSLISERTGLDLPFRHNVSAMDHDHLVGNHVHLVQDMAGNDNMGALSGQLAKERDQVSPGQRIQSVQGFIQHQQVRFVGN